MTAVVLAMLMLLARRTWRGLFCVIQARESSLS